MVDESNIEECTITASEPEGVAAFLSFDKMVGSGLIKIMYMLGFIAVTVSGLVNMFKGTGFVSGLFMLILGHLGWRIYCELCIIFYKIFETNAAMLKELKQQNR